MRALQGDQPPTMRCPIPNHLLLSQPLSQMYAISHASMYLHLQHYDPTGPMSLFLRESRRDKLERFRRKKLSRNWGKKINYLCRKEVADSRLRIKGRFVTRAQANLILGYDVSHLPVGEVRKLLGDKMKADGTV